MADTKIVTDISRLSEGRALTCAADRLRDSSGKPAEGFVRWLVADL